MPDRQKKSLSCETSSTGHYFTFVMPPQRKTSGKKNKSASHQAKGKRKNKVNVTDVYEASDDERQLARKGHDLDEVDDYEYHVDHVNEEDDEEIDSDEAFDESDDERFESFKFQGSTKVCWFRCGYVKASIF